MNENKIALLKTFSLISKERATSDLQYQEISPEMLKFFSRKELIEIITYNFNGDLPKEYNLVEMENEELLQLIGDDFSIISYAMGKWSKEALMLPTKKAWIDSKIHPTPKEETIENALETQTLDSNVPPVENPSQKETSETIVQTNENEEKEKVDAGIDSKSVSKKNHSDKVK